MKLFVAVSLAVAGSELLPSARCDPFSRGNPDRCLVETISLSLRVDFQEERLHGTAILGVRRLPGSPAVERLILDTQGLEVRSVRLLRGGNAPEDLEFSIGVEDPILGSPLSIALPGGELFEVEVSYSTGPGSRALQWVKPSGTTGGDKPFLYTQSQPIHARSWFPCQDSPGNRITYAARIEVPEGLKAVMSADMTQGKGPAFEFKMERAIPPYLVALAVGNLECRDIGPRTRVWSEPEILGKAASEFAETEGMLSAAEARFGPYRWGRYDIVVLPPSFPFGGMENAQLTFVTPTILVGDRSLVSLIAHELAHSWSGNLVTCATWNDFWLNEGVTTYLERRIMEDIRGKSQAEAEQVLGYRELLKEMQTLEPRDQTLRGDFQGRDPASVLSSVPYEKGALFLKRLELLCGRNRFDAFLEDYFERFAFRSLGSGDFVDFLRAGLGDRLGAEGGEFSLEGWLSEPGLPADTPVPVSKQLFEVEELSTRWLDRRIGADELPWSRWGTLERVHFLGLMPPRVETSRLAEIDGAFHLSDVSNSEVLVPWMEQSIRSGYEPGTRQLDRFLGTVGRMKYLEPLYKALSETPQGKARALAVFSKVRDAYHPITVSAIERVLQSPGSRPSGL